MNCSILDKEFSNQFSFSSHLSDLFNKSNAVIAESFAEKDGITANEVEKIYDLAIVDGKVIYSKDVVERVFFDNNKKQKVIDS